MVQKSAMYNTLLQEGRGRGGHFSNGQTQQVSELVNIYRHLAFTIWISIIILFFHVQLCHTSSLNNIPHINLFYTKIQY